MAKLTGMEIVKEVERGHIIIDPFDLSRVNPNSYNLRLGNKLLVYRATDMGSDPEKERRILSLPRAVNTAPGYNDVILDSHADNPTEEFIIPETGFLLQPGILYLGTTMEKTWTDRYVPELGGRSSTGRLSMMVHITAGFGDVGFDGKWTLEIVVFHNLIVYPNDEILQVHFTTTKGDLGFQYNGRYNHQDDVTASRFYMPKSGVFFNGEKVEEDSEEKPLTIPRKRRPRPSDLFALRPGDMVSPMAYRGSPEAHEEMECVKADLTFVDKNGEEHLVSYKLK